jgi:protein TonB
MRKPALLLSIGAHALAILLLVLAAILAPKVLPPHRPTVLELQPRRIEMPLPAKKGGGGQRSKLLARQGSPPPRPTHRLFVLPMIERNEQPKLVLQAALFEAPEVNMRLAVGDPFGVPGGDGGLGEGLAGIGDGKGKSVGSEDGGGVSGLNLRREKITRQAQVLYKVEPDYSEEARRANFQATVILYIEIGLDGRATNIRVMRRAGLGLDEKAIEAVRQWRFTPALAGSEPVVAPATVEIGFRLL